MADLIHTNKPDFTAPVKDNIAKMLVSPSTCMSAVILMKADAWGDSMLSFPRRRESISHSFQNPKLVVSELVLSAIEGVESI